MVVMEFTKGEMVGVGGVVKCEGWRSVRESYRKVRLKEKVRQLAN